MYFLSVLLVTYFKVRLFCHHVSDSPSKYFPFFLTLVCVLCEKILIRLETREKFNFTLGKFEVCAQDDEQNCIQYHFVRAHRLICLVLYSNWHNRKKSFKCAFVESCQASIVCGCTFGKYKNRRNLARAILYALLPVFHLLPHFIFLLNCTTSWSKNSLQTFAKSPCDWCSFHFLFNDQANIPHQSIQNYWGIYSRSVICNIS